VLNAAETAYYNNGSLFCTEIFVRQQFRQIDVDDIFIFVSLPSGGVCADITGTSKHGSKAQNKLLKKG
jgi:hypothetical protein